MLNNALEELRELQKSMGTIARTLEVSKSALYEQLDNVMVEATDEQKKEIQKLKIVAQKGFQDVENGKGIDVLKEVLKEFKNGN